MDIASSPTANETAPYYVSALLVSTYTNDYLRWNYANSLGTPVTVTYSFPTQLPELYSYGSWESNNFIPFGEAMKASAQQALAFFAEVSNLTFVEVPEDQGTIRFGTAQLPSNVGAWAYYPSEYEGVPGDVWFNNLYYAPSGDYYGSGNGAFQIMLHEIGHALGLKHPGNYDAGGGGAPGPFLPVEEDNYRYTVMSYYYAPPTYPRTPMLYDVAAIQYLYGANTNTRSGNTTYRWGNTEYFLETIWDGGGIDTIDVSNQTLGSRIILTPGSFSSIGIYDYATFSSYGLVGIAYNTWIENAIGSSADDLIYGNSLNNRLEGRGGNDNIYGFEGDDLIIAGSGANFLNGGTGNDTYLLSSPLASYAGTLIFDEGGFDTILLPGITLSLAKPTVGMYGLARVGDDLIIDINQNGIARGAEDLTLASFFVNDLSLIERVGNLLGTDILKALGDATPTSTWPDFNGDGKGDLIVQSLTDGWSGIWLGNGAGGVTAWSPLTEYGRYPGGRIVGAADMNGDGQTDIVLQGDSGNWAGAWIMDGTRIAGWLELPSSTFEIVEVIDYNNDGITDLILQDPSRQVGTVWILDRQGSLASATLLPQTNGARIAGAADFNGDGEIDIVLQGSSNDWAGIWTMRNGMIGGWTPLPSTNGAAIVDVSDVTSDNRPDLLLQERSPGFNGSAYVWRMDGATPTAWLPLPTTNNGVVTI
jgi:Ca2+-binding RTX toxin-like protein